MSGEPLPEGSTDASVIERVESSAAQRGRSASAKGSTAVDLAESIRSGVQERLASLDGLATPEHVAVFDEVQAELGATLDRLDGAAGQRSAEQG